MKLQMRFLLILTIVFIAIAGLFFAQREFDLHSTDHLVKNETLLIVVLGGLALVLILGALWLLILRPLRTITTSINRKKPEMLDGMAKKGSQFGDLAILIQQFFNQKKLIEQNEFKESELERLNKEKSTFLAVAAHELKAPGAIIKLISQDLSDTVGNTDVPPELLKQLDIITHQATKMTALVNDIRLASEGKEPALDEDTVFDFDNFLEREVTELGYIVNQKLIYQGATGKTIKTDAERLSQVVSNIIRNAAKYSYAEKEIHVTSSVKDDAILIEIEDFGLGIAKEDQAHIFERFYRAPNVADSYQGLGLGLSICKTIIDNIGGKIWVESELGHGSRFYISLPLDRLDPNVFNPTKPSKSD